MKTTAPKIVSMILVLFLVLCSEPRAEQKIGALGRIKPQGDMVVLTGPQGDRIAEIRVNEGDIVKAGDILVVFESRPSCEMEVNLAGLAAREADELGAKAVAIQEIRLKEADEGGRTAIAIQEGKVEAAKAEFDFATRRLERFRKADGQSISEQMMDERESNVLTTGSRLKSERQELQRLTLSRQISVSLAGQELERLRLDREIKMSRTRENLRVAEERLRRSAMRAPSDGTILEVLQNEGESTGALPIIRMADTSRMCVIAEIFEGDLLVLEPGMKATVTGNALPSPLTGEVRFVGRIVDPSNRTADVTILLDNPETASRLINLEVDVAILY